MSTDTYVGHEVHERMWKAHITQRAMAARLGVDESTLGRKIRGSRKWSLDELMEVASILRVPPEELLPPADSGGGATETLERATGEYLHASERHLTLLPSPRPEPVAPWSEQEAA